MTNQKKSENFACFEKVNKALTQSLQVLQYLDDDEELTKRELEALHILEDLEELFCRIPLLYDIRVPSPFEDDEPGTMVCPYPVTSDSALDYIYYTIKFRTLFREYSSAELAKKYGVSQNYINIMKTRFYKGEMTPKTAKRWVDKLSK